jgi:hypothetical protein
MSDANLTTASAGELLKVGLSRFRQVISLGIRNRFRMK